MALTGKTIGELSYLQFPTNNTLLPVEYDGGTYHITFSSITYNVGSYSQFVVEADNGLLTPGRFYLMEDYQTCYDQPNYDSLQNPIYTGNYMTGNTEPILLLAMSTTGFSPTVYSTLYPQDKISYDINWNTTEITENPAKGRITERIDEYNNRTDYDNRSILFKRYDGYSYNENNPLTGLVAISGITGNTGILYASSTGTTFTSNLYEGAFVAIRNLNPSIFEVISVEGDSFATISGATITETTDSPYYIANDDGVMSYYQPNVRQNQVYEFTTFGDAIDSEAAVNNYIGNQANLNIEWSVGDFILANNVFLSGEILNNKIGDGSYNNTFNDVCENNQIGDSFYNNSTNDGFSNNIIGDSFNNNYITTNFNENKIGYNFNGNLLINSDFYRNNIGNDFNGNVCTSGDFQNNEIGNQFQNNEIYDNFYKNDIGNGYNNNSIYSNFYGNLIGNGYNNNTIYSDFFENSIGDIFNSNIVGDNSNIGDYDFNGNRLGSDFQDNTIRFSFQNNNILNNFYNNSLYWSFVNNSILNGFEANTLGGFDNLGGTFDSNQIMNTFKGNNIQGSFTNNQVKTGFQGNQIDNQFRYNNIGEGFFTNTLDGDVMHNNIGDNFDSNSCYGVFSYNTIGTGFYSNQVQDGFGFGSGTYQGNKIGNNFNDNTIGEYFYNNSIPDNFTNNIIGNYFQWNIVDTTIDGVDFTTNYGNITGFSYTATGNTATDDTYTNIGGTTSGSGVNATFDIIVSGGSVTDVTLSNEGKEYVTGDTITILGTSIGGTDVVDDVIITVSGVSQTPAVYGLYTCNIFKNSALVDRLSYYNDIDTLTIKDINE